MFYIQRLKRLYIVCVCVDTLTHLYMYTLPKNKILFPSRNCLWICFIMSQLPLTHQFKISFDIFLFFHKNIKLQTSQSLTLWHQTKMLGDYMKICIFLDKIFYYVSLMRCCVVLPQFFFVLFAFYIIQYTFEEKKKQPI